MCTTLVSDGAVEPPTKFSKRGGGLPGPQFLQEGCWERGSDFFEGMVAIFQQENRGDCLKRDVLDSLKI